MKDERVDRLDRVVLRILAVLLIALGVAALLHATGALGSRRRASPVLSTPTVDWYRQNGSWLGPVAGGVLLVLTLLALWWVSAQVRLNGVSRVDLSREPGAALTVDGGELAECVERDAVNQEGIDRARARISATEDAVHVWITIWVAPPYDVGRSVSRVANTVLPKLRTTLDAEPRRAIRTHITVETAEAPVSRLR